MRIVFVFLLLVGCASAKPAVRPTTKPTITVSAPLVVEKVTESELLHYRAAFLTFRALEEEILAKYRIRLEKGETFDPETGVVTRTKKEGGR